MRGVGDLKLLITDAGFESFALVGSLACNQPLTLMFVQEQMHISNTFRIYQIEPVTTPLSLLCNALPQGKKVRVHAAQYFGFHIFKSLQNV
jgi:hypothetical protein